MHVRRVSATVLTFTALFAATAGAQSSTSAASQVAIMRTPLGALPPVAGREMRALPERGLGVRLQYGYVGGPGAFNFNNFGAGFDLPFGRGTAGVTIGFTAPTCPDGVDCDGNVMIGANWDRRLVGTSLGVGSEAVGLTIGVDAAVGAAWPDETSGLGSDGSAWALGLGLPIALNSGGTGVRYHPFIVPRLAWGRLRSDLGGDSGAGLMLGGGLGVSGLWDRVSLHVGLQRYLVTLSNAQVGVAVTVAPRR